MCGVMPREFPGKIRNYGLVGCDTYYQVIDCEGLTLPSLERIQNYLHSYGCESVLDFSEEKPLLHVFNEECESAERELIDDYLLTIQSSLQDVRHFLTTRAASMHDVDNLEGKLQKDSDAYAHFMHNLKSYLFED